MHGYDQRYSPGPPDIFPHHGIPFVDGRGAYGPPGHPAAHGFPPDRGPPLLPFPPDRDGRYHHQERPGRYTPDRLRGPPQDSFPSDSQLHQPPEGFAAFPSLCGQEIKE